MIVSILLKPKDFHFRLLVWAKKKAKIDQNNTQYEDIKMRGGSGLENESLLLKVL